MGGGLGSWLSALLEHKPGLRGMLVDLPGVVAAAGWLVGWWVGAGEHMVPCMLPEMQGGARPLLNMPADTPWLHDSGAHCAALLQLPPVAEERWRQECPHLLARASFVGADFFSDALPPADAYFLRFILHDWPDAEAAAILRAVRRAVHPGSRALLLVQDVVMPERQPGVLLTTLDLQVGWWYCLLCVPGSVGTVAAAVACWAQVSSVTGNWRAWQSACRSCSDAALPPCLPAHVARCWPLAAARSAP